MVPRKNNYRIQYSEPAPCFKLTASEYFPIQLTDITAQCVGDRMRMIVYRELM